MRYSNIEKLEYEHNIALSRYWNNKNTEILENIEMLQYKLIVILRHYNIELYQQTTEIKLLLSCNYSQLFYFYLRFGVTQIFNEKKNSDILGGVTTPQTSNTPQN